MESNFESELIVKFPFPFFLTDTVANRVVYNRHKERVGLDGYVALLSSVTNAGKNWDLLLNITNGGLYFNEISCTDSLHCWAVLEGVDSLANG